MNTSTHTLSIYEIILSHTHILNEDNNNQIDLQERIINAKEHSLCYKNFLKMKTCQRN